MLRLIISYDSKNDGDQAKELMESLNIKGEQLGVECILAPELTQTLSPIESNISREFDKANAWIIFYSKKAKKNQWVNQELGYCFNLYKKTKQSLIILWEKRNDIKGFIDKNSYHIDEKFQLSQSIDTISTNIIGFLVDKFSIPVKLNHFRLFQNNKDSFFLPKNKRLTGYQELIFEIENTTLFTLLDGMLDIILPSNIELLHPFIDDFPGEHSTKKSFKLTARDQIHYHFYNVKSDDMTKFEVNEICKTFKSNFCPHSFEKKLNNNPDFVRYSLPIKKLNVLSSTPCKFIFPYGLLKIDFGIHISIPEFGDEFYQINIDSDQTSETLMTLRATNENENH